MDKRDYFIILYDFYSSLFSLKQKEYFEDYKKETKRVRKIYLFNHMKKNHNFTGKKRLRVS